MSILVTRPTPSGEELVEQLKALALSAHHAPLISIMPGTELPLLASKLSLLTKGDQVFLLSKNAVWHAHLALRRRGLTWPDTLSYYAIGSSTGQYFQQLTGQAINWSDEGETSEIILSLAELQWLAGKKVLLLRGNGGREHLASTLSERGADVDYCECYSRQPISYDPCQFNAQWQSAGISTIVITSGQILSLLTNLITDEYKDWWFTRRLVVVSQRIANIAQNMGWQNIDIATSADNNALINALTQPTWDANL